MDLCHFMDKWSTKTILWNEIQNNRHRLELFVADDDADDEGDDDEGEDEEDETYVISI